MTLKVVYANEEAIPEEAREHFSKGDDGKFYLDTGGTIPQHFEARGLVENRDKILAEKKELQEEHESTLESLKTEYEGKLEEIRKNAGSEEDVERLKKEYEDKVSQAHEKAQKEIQKAKEEAEAERQAAREFFRESQVTAAVSAAGGEPALLSHEVTKRTKVERGEDGKFQLQVIDPQSGQVRIKDSAGTPFGLPDLVEELKSDDRFARAFDATGRGGSGAKQPGAGGGGGARTIDRNDPMAWADAAEGIVKGEVGVK